ncbi:MAG: AMP-binding protein [Oscillospiraceae bacterium]|nr:AMP-binding protein [Oscillospiraceae bacterium]
MLKKKLFKELPFDFSTIPELIQKTTDKHSELIAVSVRTKNTQKDFTYQEFYHHVLSVCNWLASNNISNRKVALIGKNGYAWLAAFLAICASGNTAVLFDADAPDEEWIRCSQSCLPDWTICDTALEARVKTIFGDNCLPLDSELLEALGHTARPETGAFCASVTPESDAAVVFTSGTSGANKGVLLSHHNLCSDIKASLMLSGVNEKDNILAVLPPHHAFQLVTGLLTPYSCGMTVFFGRGLKYLKKDLAECRPSFLVLVPVIVRSLEKQIQSGIQRENKEKAVSKALRLSSFLLKCGIDVRKRLFSEIHETMGGRIRSIICGGAALEDDVVARMISYGLPVMTGYGITECSPVVSCNQLERYKIGTVGRPTPYCEVKVIDGEIAVRGDIVSRGYYHMPEETARSFRDGWFFTGDLGTIDKKGFLTITGRKKNLIILNNGKNVSPEELESAIHSIEGIREVLVKGNQDELPDYLVATIWVEESDCADPAVCKMLYQKRIDELNQTLPSYKRIQSFEICKAPINYTRTGKVKRGQVPSSAG